MLVPWNAMNSCVVVVKNKSWGGEYRWKPAGSIKHAFQGSLCCISTIIKKHMYVAKQVAANALKRCDELRYVWLLVRECIEQFHFIRRYQVHLIPPGWPITSWYSTTAHLVCFKRVHRSEYSCFHLHDMFQTGTLKWVSMLLPSR